MRRPENHRGFRSTAWSARRQARQAASAPVISRAAIAPITAVSALRASSAVCTGSNSNGIGAVRSLGLVGVALREDELNGGGELVGVVLVVLAQEKNFIVELAGAWRCSAAAGAGAEGGGGGRSLWGRWRSWACRSAAFRASSAARPAGPPAFQSRDWRTWRVIPGGSRAGLMGLP